MGFSLFGVVLPALFILLNIYLARRGWQALQAWFPGARLKVYIPLYILLASSFILERFANGLMGENLEYIMSVAGYILVVFTLYAVLLCLLIDLIRLLNHFMHFLPEDKPYARILGPTCLIIISLLVGYGFWNARTTVVTSYDIYIDKPAGEMKQLRAVVVSDIHAGMIIHNGRLMVLADEINALNPDIVLIPGDILDLQLSRLAEENVASAFARIKSRYGTYASPGNHDHIDGNDGGSVMEYLKQGNIQMLVDQAVLIDNSFYIVGRADGRGFTSDEGGTSLAGVLEGLDLSLPTLVMDHKPTRYAEEQGQGVDLVISGHTHAGQFWPVNLVTDQMYVNDYGLYQDGSFNAIVTSGWGTWGPPLRIGSHSEIALITVHFSPASE